MTQKSDGVEEWIERACLLFEAGDYADKGVTITEADLRTIARNTAREVPVRIEHLAESPFDGALGVVTSVEARGRELWGTIRQPIEAWHLVRKAGAKSLSVGLDMAGKRLVETSYVCRPRVAGARVFHDPPQTANACSTVRSPYPSPSPSKARERGDNLLTSRRLNIREG